ncbi:AI-2E family transporter [Lysobacter soyae]|uniref:AI-2E family transporter n=2 Tax=Lysobacter soyae TaxID=2764185 RepID=A0ABX8WT71_9GAMM|nr:AI-2E family transporter [Lysobacter sp. CJ11]
MAVLVLATIAVGAVAWLAQSVILPVLLAIFLSLIGNPIIRALRKLYLPRALAAILVVAGGLTLTGVLVAQLIEPAKEWAHDVPKQVSKLTPKIKTLIKPVQDANRVAENIAQAAGSTATTAQKPMVVKATSEEDKVISLATTPKHLTQVFSVILLTLFFMIFGENLQRHAIDLLPGWRRKKLTVEILQAIEREMSRYVLTISAINLAMGFAIALGLYFIAGMNLQETLLWGTMAALLNFAPYLGPAIGVLVMLVVGFVQEDQLWPALLPAGIYLALHTLEGQIVTPLILGKRLAISPLILMVALLVFGSGWGIVGLLLAVPLLACVKIVLSKIEGMEGWARLLE